MSKTAIGKNGPTLWACTCGFTENTGRFCMERGKPRPLSPAYWTCPCCGESTNSGRFCTNCGIAAPVSAVPTPESAGECWAEVTAVEIKIDEAGNRTTGETKSCRPYFVKASDLFFEEHTLNIDLRRLSGSPVLGMQADPHPILRMEAVEEARIVLRDADGRRMSLAWGESFSLAGSCVTYDGNTNRPAKAAVYRFAFYKTWKAFREEPDPFEVLQKCTELIGTSLTEASIPPESVLDSGDGKRQFLKIRSTFLGYDVSIETLPLEPDSKIGSVYLYFDHIHLAHVCAVLGSRYRFVHREMTPYIPSSGGSTTYISYEDPASNEKLTIAAGRQTVLAIGRNPRLCV